MTGFYRGRLDPTEVSHWMEQGALFSEAHGGKCRVLPNYLPSLMERDRVPRKVVKI